jgi:hypothetical protein
VIIRRGFLFCRLANKLLFSLFEPNNLTFQGMFLGNMDFASRHIVNLCMENFGENVSFGFLYLARIVNYVVW